MSISAAVEETAGKAVDLIQHTPKRDKGPQLKPERVRLAPHPDGSLGLFPGGLVAGRIHHEYDSATAAGAANGTDLPTIAHFERIQFKSATANNGKRRAAQQYYHLVIDLFADIGGTMGVEGRWVKVAERISAPVVVRGRSPGHYQDDRRGSSSSLGARGAGPGDQGGRMDAYGAAAHAAGPSLGEPLSLMSGPGPGPALGVRGSGAGGAGGAAAAFMPWHGSSHHGLSPHADEPLWRRRLSNASSSDRDFDVPPCGGGGGVGGACMDEVGRLDGVAVPYQPALSMSLGVPWHLGGLAVRHHVRTDCHRPLLATQRIPAELPDVYGVESMAEPKWDMNADMF
jgi:hypothetical protein